MHFTFLFILSSLTRKQHAWSQGCWLLFLLKPDQCVWHVQSVQYIVDDQMSWMKEQMYFFGTLPVTNGADSNTSLLKTVWCLSRPIHVKTPLLGRGFPLPAWGLASGQGRKPGLNGHNSDRTVSRKREESGRKRKRTRWKKSLACSSHSLCRQCSPAATVTVCRLFLVGL